MTEELLAIFAALPDGPDDAETLYARCYCRHVLQAMAGGDPGDVAAANCTREAIDYGWLAEQPAGQGFVVARKQGAVRMFRPGQYLTLRGPGARVEPDESIRVMVSTGSADLQPGFYHALGETISDYEEFEDLLRIYWNVAPEGAATLMAGVTAEFNRFGVPFRFKCGQTPEIYERRDPAVLYVHRRYYQIAAQLVERVHTAASRWMREGVPLFTRPWARGLGFAEDPGGSFGKSRCAILSEAMAATRGMEPAARLDELRRRFAARGLSLDAPWLNAGSTDRYPFPFRGL